MLEIKKQNWKKYFSFTHFKNKKHININKILFEKIITFSKIKKCWVWRMVLTYIFDTHFWCLACEKAYRLLCVNTVFWLEHSPWNFSLTQLAFGYEPLPGAGEQCTVRSEGLHSPGPVTGRTGSADPSGWPLVETLWRISFSLYSVSHFPSFLQWVSKYYSLE